MRRLVTVGAVVLLLSVDPLAHVVGEYDDDDRWSRVGSFRPVATFNVPGATSAEIVSASLDGNLLVYSDATGEQFGFVDISDPRSPHQLATVPGGGSPTSVAVLPVGN
ncbi:MAG: hypothetical protein ACRD1Q_05375, partial [Vicinamibacterales bacterium]